MKRIRSRVTIQPDGHTTVKAEVPATIWKMIEKYAETIHVTPIQSWAIFLNRLESLIDEGTYDFIGPEFSRVIRGLVATDAIGTSGLPPLQMGKLHRSFKTKSGFVGVYMNGNGFRAMAKQPGSGVSIQASIGTFPTAEQAAWARYLYYKKNNMAYGEVEAEIDDWRKRNADRLATASDDEVLADYNEMSGLTPLSKDAPLSKEPIKPFGLDDDVDFGH